MSRPSPTAATFRPNTVAHRWGGVVGDSITALSAVGVRYDEEDRQRGESLLVTLAPGRIERRAALPFTVHRVGGTTDAPLVVDEPTHALWRIGAGAPTRLRDDVAAIDGVLVLGSDGVVQRVAGSTLETVATGARGVARGIVVGADTLTLLDDEGHPAGTIPFVAPGVVRAVHRDGDRVGVYVETTFHTLDLATGARQTFAGPAQAHCLARGPDRWFIGCTLGGLLTVDDGDDAIRIFRPSLRAHQILQLKDGFVAVSDLSIAVSDDGHEWLGRDLGGLVRLFEHH